MADNFILQPGQPSPTIRSADKTTTGAPQTEIVQLDLGGKNWENLAQSPLAIQRDDQPLDEDNIPVVDLGPNAEVLAVIPAQQFNQLIGPPLTPAPALQIPVGVASVQALPANPRRRGAVFTNVSTSGQRIAFSLGLAAAVVDTGIVLQPGDIWEMDNPTFVQTAVQIIASAASGALAIQEFNL